MPAVISSGARSAKSRNLNVDKDRQIPGLWPGMTGWSGRTALLDIDYFDWLGGAVV